MSKREPPAAPSREPRAHTKRRRTRIKLLKAAYELMSAKGVDGTTILEITERADIGFGTFYNYFSSKDEVATSVLDCVIHTLGRRNDLASAASGIDDPHLIVANSIRGVGREMMQDKMWHWWLKRPDLLVDRMRDGFHPFAIRDIERTAATGAETIADLESLWSLLIWLLAGRVLDISNGVHGPKSEQDLGEAVLRLLGVEAKRARKLSARPVPPLPPAEIDFSFEVAPPADIRADVA